MIQLQVTRSSSINEGAVLTSTLIKDSFSNSQNFKSLYKGIYNCFYLSFQPSLQITIYQTILNNSIKKTSKKSDKIIIYSGTISTFLSSTIIFPFNYIKAKQQQLSNESSKYHDVKNIQNKLYESNFNASKYVSISSSIKTIYTENGIKGFFRGYTPVLLKNILRSGSFFILFEKIKDFLIISKNSKSKN